MGKLFRSSVLAVIVAFALVISGCACKKDFGKSNMFKGMLIGVIPGAAVGAQTSDDDKSDEIAAGMAAGAIVGGVIGMLFDTCDEPVQVAQAADVDSDGDGVVDRLDQCPDTPKGVPVDYKGCPMKDSDGDGVYDDKDKCPDTPKGVAVDSDGCPLDEDKDGVYDSMDKCPGTPAGVKVDANGCPMDEDKDTVTDDKDECPKTPEGATVNKAGCWVLNNVLFDLNQATIKPAFYPELDKVVTILNSQAALGVELEGHTCNLGSDAHNMRLSEKRAKAVMEYLISKGIDKSRLSAKGYGETKPTESNDTDEGRQANRRVQISPIW